MKTLKPLVWAALIVAPTVASAQQIPPPQSPQDQACRNEAQQRVFSQPNPGGDLYRIGRRYWTECMRRAQRGKRTRTGRG